MRGNEIFVLVMMCTMSCAQWDKPVLVNRKDYLCKDVLQSVPLILHATFISRTCSLDFDSPFVCDSTLPQCVRPAASASLDTKLAHGDSKSL